MVTARTDIARLDRPSRELFEREHLRPQVPCVIRGYVDEWPAASAWDDDYLREKIGDLPVSVTRSKGDRRLFEDEASAVEEMSFARFLELDHSPEAETKYFLMQRSLDVELPPLFEDVSPPPLFDPKRLFLVNFWYSPGGNKTPLHCDFIPNLLCMISGKKRVILVPPGSKVYPHPRKANFSRVDIEEPDLERFPRFSLEGAYDVELQPGEMLFIPGLWWHQVYSEANIAVNWWWKPGGLALASMVLHPQVAAFAARHAKDKLLTLLGFERKTNGATY
jgi:lysine-specific demethylase 8